jgi:ParB/RepB/Spo0J family partition protein
MGRPRQPFHHLTRLPVAAIVVPKGEAPAPEAVERLALSLRRQGQREPVLVAAGPNGGTPSYRLVVGRQRVAAARKLGWSEMDALLLDASFAEELGVITRLQAGAYEPQELAGTLQRLQERCGWTQAQLGMAIGRNRDFVAGLLALTDITPEVRAYLAQHARQRRLSARHLRYIGRAARARQMALARQILEDGLSTKVLEQRFRSSAKAREFIKVRALRQPPPARGPKTAQQWRRYYRKLRTDLRRIDEQEARELRRTADQVTLARQRQRLIRQQARAKRMHLRRELRRATRQLTRRGTL